MKKLITLIAIALISLGAKAQTEVFTIKFANPLTTAQKQALTSRMITKFTSNCRPQSITVGTQMCSTQFGQPCMTEVTIKTITEKCLTDNHCANSVIEVTKSSMAVLRNGEVKNKKTKKSYH